MVDFIDRKINSVNNMKWKWSNKKAHSMVLSEKSGKCCLFKIPPYKSDVTMIMKVDEKNLSRTRVQRVTRSGKWWASSVMEEVIYEMHVHQEREREEIVILVILKSQHTCAKVIRSNIMETERCVIYATWRSDKFCSCVCADESTCVKSDCLRWEYNDRICLMKSLFTRVI